MKLWCVLSVSLFFAGCGDVLDGEGCLEDAAPDTPVTCADIASEQARLSNLDPLEIDEGTCPATLGSMDGFVVVERYFCSDVCPDAGGIGIYLDGLDATACEAAGHTPIDDPAWGSYIGCAPKCD